MMNTERSAGQEGERREPGAVAVARSGAIAHADSAARASVTGTERLAARFAAERIPDFYRAAAGGLHASSIGVGTYLGEPDDADDRRYEEALRAAVAAVLNVIDTAINYRCQRSERVVGRALAALFDDRVARRDEVIVCSKGGYIPLDGSPPASRDEYNALIEREYFARGVMRPEDVVGGGHCMAPGYLADQVARSRANLGLETIDVYYLHNPEQQVASIGRELFQRRVVRAFEALESRVDAGGLPSRGM